MDRIPNAPETVDKCDEMLHHIRRRLKYGCCHLGLVLSAQLICLAGAAAYLPPGGRWVMYLSCPIWAWGVKASIVELLYKVRFQRALRNHRATLGAGDD